MRSKAVSDEELHEIFTTNLPYVDPDKSHDFIYKMREYHTNFRQFSEWDINYQKDDNYLNELVHITSVDPEDYWVYSPQFKKVVGLVIGKLFRTKIQFVSIPYPIGYSHSINVIDKHMNRWSLIINEPNGEPEKARICMLFPRPVTQIMETSPVSTLDLNNPNYNTPVIVANASKWYED
jgi:hypothetical protein